MKYYLFIPLVLLICLLQATVIVLVTPLGARLNLPLVILACWAMVRGPNEAMVLVLVAGLALGLLTGEPLGASLLALAPIPLLAVMREIKITGSDLIPTMLVVSAAVLSYYVIEALRILIMGPPIDWLAVPAGIVGPELAASLVITPVVYWIIKGASFDLRRQRLPHW